MIHDRIKTVLATHCRRDFFKGGAFGYGEEIISHTLDVLARDLWNGGDITSAIMFKKTPWIEAKIVSKSNGILAGMSELKFFLKFIHKCGLGRVELKQLKRDGVMIAKGHKLALLKGNATDILKLERTALNLLQRMSGVATITRRFVKKVPANICITPTRKTLWGMLDKRACVVGGGGTHRLNLSDAVVIKDTHLRLAGGNFEQIFKKLAAAKQVGKFIEIEVESVNDALKAAQWYYKYLLRRRPHVPFYLMLDNMSPAAIKKTVNSLRKHKLYHDILLEASGGITLKNVAMYAKCGVDVIAVGAITHSAPALDIGLKIVRSGNDPGLNLGS